MSKIASFVLKLIGWKVVGIQPKEEKFIIIVAPHTSWQDFFIGKIALSVKNISAKVFIKSGYFVFPFKKLFIKLGGIPINRGQASKIVEHTVNLINESKNFVLVITPEGTRKYTTNWKKGYYYIAMRAKIPIYAGYLDYEKKTCCIKCKIEVTGDYNEDFLQIENVYKGVKAKHPENFNL